MVPAGEFLKEEAEHLRGRMKTRPAGLANDKISPDRLPQIAPGQWVGPAQVGGSPLRAYWPGVVPEYIGQSLTKACTTGLPTA
jgi:hypothetical protein